MKAKKIKEKGAILIFTVLLMSVILATAIASINILIPKLKLAKSSSNSVAAIFAAESFIEWCVYEIRNGAIGKPVMSNEATYEINPPIASCVGQTLDHVVSGEYIGTKRSLEIRSGI
jgi:hypothetical protein